MEVGRELVIEVGESPENSDWKNSTADKINPGLKFGWGSTSAITPTNMKAPTIGKILGLTLKGICSPGRFLLGHDGRSVPQVHYL
ncbi:MAG TPA: hypothetical protein DDZ80_30120 [Cyanobacteria bacterium UBA8803]|nr:hypothetical protein [Cyanobacteria bacterium UBA9273]HBL62491.1 hypothetical protein [Cyanobacteria bacterium UBA8803]